jgi:hypothetical protein
VVAGEQVGTFLPEYATLNGATAALVQATLKGVPLTQTKFINARFDNGYVKGGVPSYFAPEIPITATSVQSQIIAKRIYTKKQVCGGVAAKSAFCKAK